MAVRSERPGVYAAYQVSGLVNAGSGQIVVGAAAAAEGGESGKVYTISTAAGAAETFGPGSGLTELIGILLKNGAAVVKAVKVDEETAESYGKAFQKLQEEDAVRILVCGSREGAVHAKLLESIEDAPERNAYRIGIVEASGGAQDLIGAAAALNHERMVLVGPVSEKDRAGTAAAALAGLLSAQTDPALPVNGAELLAVGDLENRFSDSEVDSLILGGVTPLEQVNGTVSVIRGVTTRTKSGDAPDSTWRELTTILIVDDVIPAVRDSLKARFVRAKNTAQTRGAIRTQVILELQEKLRREIIDSYDAVTVEQDTADPTLCLVNFQFTVAHGLNRISLTAHITV